MADNKEQKEMTPEQLKAITDKIAELEQLSLQNAAEHSFVSSFYLALFRATRRHSVKLATLQVAAHRRDIAKQRKAAKEGNGTSSGTQTSQQTSRQTAR